MKHLLILAILAVLLTLALVGTEVVGQGSPVSPVSPIPSPTVSWIAPPPRYFPTPTPDPLMDQMMECWYLCKVTKGLTDGKEIVDCYRECMREDESIPTEIADPQPTVVPIALGEFCGTWWKNEYTECNLYTDGYRIVRIECDE